MLPALLVNGSCGIIGNKEIIMPISLPGPPDYVEYVNSSGITFLVPEQSAPANVPYSLKVLAESIEKDDLHNGDDFYLQVSGANSMTGNLDVGNQDIVNANDVGAVSVSSTTAVVSGQATAGSVVVSNVVAPDTAAVRNIIHSLTEPTSSDGNNGDIWFTYKDE